jgi:hypothetical protein
VVVQFGREGQEKLSGLTVNHFMSCGLALSVTGTANNPSVHPPVSDTVNVTCSSYVREQFELHTGGAERKSPFLDHDHDDEDDGARFEEGETD